MGPMEILWLTVLLFFVGIALVRGYPKELGITTLIFGLLFIITEFGIVYLPQLFDTIAAQLNLTSYDQRTQEHLVSITLSLIFILVLFAGYAGSTLAFPGKPARGGKGFILNVLVGLLNGYLIAGTLWWLQDVNNYPVTATGWLTLPLTPFAETIAAWLPPYVAPPVFWAVMVVVMLVLRVRK